MKKLLRFLKPYKLQAILAPIFKMLEALMDLLVPVIVAGILNTGVAAGNSAAVTRDFWLLVLLALLGMGFSFTAQYFAARASVGMCTDIRQELFDHIQKLSYSDLDHVGTDTLITRMTSDVNQVQTAVNLALRLALRSPFIVFGSMIMAFTINVRCALIFVVAIPVLTAVVMWIMLKSIPLLKKAQIALDSLTSSVRENLTGVRVIRAFCQEEKETEKFDARNEALTKINETAGRLSAALNPVTYLLINLATIFLIHQAGVQVNIGGMQQGDAVAMYNYMAQMIVELIKLASLIITIDRGAACADRIQSVFEINCSMQYPDHTVVNQNADPESSVDFDHVSFSYADAGAEALTDINLHVRKGQTIGIIGGTGCGKSSVVNLIPRFYDATSGTVSVDGTDVRNYAEGELIQKIGMVPQKAVLFRGTIRENLKYGNENASDEDLWNAIKTAQAMDVVNGKEGKLDYQIEQNGRNLSGGQKQRLTIARALVKKPEILIMDDSASALDFATDAALRKAVHDLEGNMTVFIVSQRTSSIRNCDQILVLNDGKQVSLGKHEELMQDCEIYREIYYSQFPEERPENKEKAEVLA